MISPEILKTAVLVVYVCSLFFMFDRLDFLYNHLRIVFKALFAFEQMQENKKIRDQLVLFFRTVIYFSNTIVFVRSFSADY